MRVTEIFFSIQGEGTRAGRPCVFVRFTGCDLRCGYCDTAYAFHGGRTSPGRRSWRRWRATRAASSSSPAASRCCSASCRSSPSDLLARGVRGRGGDPRAAPTGALPPEVIRILDVKTPGSGEPATDFALPRRAQPHDEVKFVVCSEDDFRWSERGGPPARLEGRSHLLFSPVWGQVEPQGARALASWRAGSTRGSRCRSTRSSGAPTTRGV